jgi:hypothetical protein
MPEQYADAPDGTADFLDAWLPPKSGFADRVPGHLETIRRAEELLDKGDYDAAAKLLKPVNLDYKMAGAETPAEYDAVSNKVQKAFMEEYERDDAVRDEKTNEMHKLQREIDDLSLQTLDIIRNSIPDTQRLLEIFRKASEAGENPLPPEYYEIRESLEELEANTAPGAEMLKDLDKASTYALQEYKRIGQIVETKLNPKRLGDEEDV